MTQTSEAAGGDGSTGTTPAPPRERVSVWPIREAEARQDAEMIQEMVHERDLNDEETP